MRHHPPHPPCAQSAIMMFSNILVICTMRIQGEQHHTAPHSAPCVSPLVCVPRARSSFAHTVPLLWPLDGARPAHRPGTPRQPPPPRRTLVFVCATVSSTVLNPTRRVRPSGRIAGKGLSVGTPHDEMVKSFGLTWLLAGTSLGHIVGAGAILGCTSAGFI